MTKKITPYGGFCFAILNNWWTVHCQRFPYIFQHVAAVGDISGLGAFSSLGWIWMGPVAWLLDKFWGPKTGPMRRVRFWILLGLFAGTRQYVFLFGPCQAQKQVLLTGPFWSPQDVPLAPFKFNRVKKKHPDMSLPAVTCSKVFGDFWPWIVSRSCLGVANKNPPNGVIFPCHLFVKYPARVSSEPFQKGTVQGGDYDWSAKSNYVRESKTWIKHNVNAIQSKSETCWSMFLNPIKAERTFP